MTRGRKRTFTNREPNGRAQRERFKPDMGAEGLQMQRAWNAQGGDMAKCTNPIGILAANQAITIDQEKAADDYRRCFQVVYRRADISAAPLDGVERGESDGPPEKVIERCRAILAPMQKALDQLARVKGRCAKDCFDNIVVYERVPRWMQPVPPRDSDARMAALFMEALRAVTEARQNPLQSPRKVA